MVNPEDYVPSAVAEPLEDYSDGGLHPVHIDDQFHNGRYQIVNKLGFGGYATVWVARDHRKNTLVALKAVCARHSKDTKELRILQRIQNDTTYHPGRKYFPQLLDHFYHGSRVRRCLFLVMELLGPDLSLVGRFEPKKRYSIPAARTLSKQLLLAVDYLQSRGIVHADLHDRNILYRIPDDVRPNFELKEGKAHDNHRKDGAPVEEGMPRYIVEPARFTEMMDVKEFRKFDHIQIIDFSSSFFESKPPATLHPVIYVLPPEWLFRQPFGKAVDIWSLACTTFIIVTGQPIFQTMGHCYGDLFSQMYKAIGESSAPWFLDAWIDVVHRRAWDDLPRLHIGTYWDCGLLEDEVIRFYEDEDGKGHVSDDEKRHLAVLSAYLRRMLIADPSKRASTKELQGDEWVQVPGEREPEQEPEQEPEKRRGSWLSRMLDR